MNQIVMKMSDLVGTLGVGLLKKHNIRLREAPAT